MAFVVSEQLPTKGYPAHFILSRIHLMKSHKQMAFSSHPLVLDQKRPVEYIQIRREQWNRREQGTNVLLILLGFHTPGLSRKKPSLIFYIGFEFRALFFFTIRKEIKHYSMADQVFLASHSRRQVPSSLTNFLYIIKGKPLLKKVLRYWWVARRD